MSKDPLLQPFLLKNLTLRNRIMTTSHEPAYPEDGMPKERYRAYHEERAKAGVALAMTAGSAAVSKDSPPVFNNVLAYKDEVVPWIQNLTDGCHEHGCAVMIQLTHLGRRTNWNKHDWLPVVSSSKHREPAHKAFPKLIEDWDIARIINDFADAAERMKSGGMDGIELQVYGHLLDQFWSPLTNDLIGPYGNDTLENRMKDIERERISPPRSILEIVSNHEEEEDGEYQSANSNSGSEYYFRTARHLLLPSNPGTNYPAHKQICNTNTYIRNVTFFYFRFCGVFCVIFSKKRAYT